MADRVFDLIDVPLLKLAGDGGLNGFAFRFVQKRHKIDAHSFLKVRLRAIAQHAPEIVGILGKEESIASHAIGDKR